MLEQEGKQSCQLEKLTMIFQSCIINRIKATSVLILLDSLINHKNFNLFFQIIIYLKMINGHNQDVSRVVASLIFSRRQLIYKLVLVSQYKYFFDYIFIKLWNLIEFQTIIVQTKRITMRKSSDLAIPISFLQIGDWIMIKKANDHAIGVTSIDQLKINALPILDNKIDSSCKLQSYQKPLQDQKKYMFQVIPYSSATQKQLFTHKEQINGYRVNMNPQKVNPDSKIVLKINTQQDNCNKQVQNCQQSIVKPQDLILLMHIQTKTYLCAAPEQGSSIIHIVMSSQITQNCVFCFQHASQQKHKQSSRKEFIQDRQQLLIVHYLTKKNLRVTINEDLNNEFSASLTRKKEHFSLKIIRKKHKKYSKFLSNESTVLLQNKQKGVLIGVASKKPFIIMPETQDHSSKIQINCDFFSSKNSQIKYYSIQQFSQLHIMDCLWQVKRITRQQSQGQSLHSGSSYFIKQNQQFILKHVKTGLFLTKDQQTDIYDLLQIHDSQKILAQMPIKIRNVSFYKFQESPQFSKFIFIDGAVKLDASPSQYMLSCVTKKSYSLMINQKLKDCLCYLLSFLQSFSHQINDTQQEQMSSFQLKRQEQLCRQNVSYYVKVFNFFSREIQDTNDKGFYLFQISYSFLTLLHQKIHELKGIFQNGQTSKMIKALTLSILQFITCFILKGKFEKVLKQTKRELLKKIITFFKIEQRLVKSIVMRIACDDPIFAIKYLFQKIKAKSLSIEHKYYIVSTMRMIIEPFATIKYDWEKLIKGMFNDIKVVFLPNKLTIADLDSSLQLELFEAKQQQKSNVDQQSVNTQQGKSQNRQPSPILKATKSKDMINMQNNSQAIYKKLSDAYLEEVLLLMFYSGSKALSYQGQQELVQGLKSNISSAKSIRKRTIIISILNILFVKSFSISLFFSTNFLFYESELNQDTHLFQILNYKPSRDFFNIQYIIQLLQDLSYKQFDRQNISDSIKYLSKVIEATCNFLMTGNYTLQQFNAIQDLIIKIANVVSGTKVKDYMQTFTAQINKKFWKLQKKQPMLYVRLKTQQLINNLGQAFKVIYLQKYKLMSYPLVADRLAIFRIQQLKQKYRDLISNQIIANEFQTQTLQQILQLIQLKNGRSTNVRVFWASQKQKNPSIFVQLQKMEIIIEKINNIEIIVKMLGDLDHGNKVQSNTISQIIQKLQNIVSKLGQIRGKHNQKYVRAFNIPERVFRVIFNNSYLNSNVVRPLVSFLKQLPPQFNTVFDQQYHQAGHLIQVLVKCIQTAKGQALSLGDFKDQGQQRISSISFKIRINDQTQENDDVKSFQKQEQYLELLYACQKIIPEQQFIQSLGAIQQILKSSDKINTTIYQTLLNYQKTYQYLNACQTYSSLKFFWIQTQNGSRFNQTIDDYRFIMSLIFRVSASSKTCQKHLRNFIQFSEIIKIVSNSQIPYYAKNPLLIYLKSSPKLFSDGRIVQNYISWIQSILGQSVKYQSQLSSYDISNIFTDQPIDAQVRLLKENEIKKVAQGDYSKAIKRKDYWEFLFTKPFFREQEGLLDFLEFIIMNMNKKKKASLGEKNKSISQIHHSLQNIFILTKNYHPKLDYFNRKILKLMIILEEMFQFLQELRVNIPQMNQRQKNQLDLLVNKIISLDLVKPFTKLWGSNSDTMQLCTQQQSCSSQNSQMLIQSSQQLSHHALIVPAKMQKKRRSVDYLNQNPKQGYVCFNQAIKIVKRICKDRSVLDHYEQIQYSLLLNYKTGRNIKDIVKMVHYKINSLREASLYNPQTSKYPLDYLEFTSQGFYGTYNSHSMKSMRAISKTSNVISINKNNGSRSQLGSQIYDIIIQQQFQKNQAQKDTYVTFSTLQFFLSNSAIHSFWNIFISSKDYLSRNLSYSQCLKLIEYIIHDQTQNRNLNIEIKSIKQIIKIIPQTGNALEMLMTHYFYKFSIENHAAYFINKDVKTSFLIQIVELYALFIQKAQRFYPNLLALVEAQALSKLNINEKMMALSIVFPVFLQIIQGSQINQDKTDQIIDSISFSNIKKLILQDFQAFTKLSLESQNLNVNICIKLTEQILNFLLSIVMILPVKFINEYFKGDLATALIRMQICIYNKLFDTEYSLGGQIWEIQIKSSAVRTQRRAELTGILIKSLNLFHNIRVKSGSPLWSLDMIQQRVQLIISEKEKQNFQSLRDFYQNLSKQFSFVLVSSKWLKRLPKIETQKDQQFSSEYNLMVNSFPSGQKISLPWKGQFINELIKQKSLHLKKSLVFTATNVIYQESQNLSLASEKFKKIYNYRWFFTIACLIILLVSQILVAYVQIFPNIIIYANFPFLLCALAAKFVYLQQIVKFKLNIMAEKNFLGIVVRDSLVIVGLSLFLIAVNLFSFFDDSMRSFLYLIVPLMDQNFSLAINKALFQYSSLKIQIFLTISIFLLTMTSLYMPGTNIAEVSLFQLKLSTENQPFYFSFVDLLLSKWKSQYDFSFTMWIFSILTLYILAIIFAVVVYFYISDSIFQHSAVDECHLCLQINSQNLSSSERSVSKKDPLKHIEYYHNLFKYIEFFIYILNKNQKTLSRFQQHIKVMIVNRNAAIFPQ